MQPRDINIRVNGTAALTVVASGEDLTYQWLGPDGTPLSDIPGKITGATTSTLEIFNIQSDDTRSYQVRVSNVGGSVNSDTATLALSKINMYLYQSKLLILYTCTILHIVYGMLYILYNTLKTKFIWA